jgi:hypothetical protein
MGIRKISDVMPGMRVFIPHYKDKQDIRFDVCSVNIESKEILLVNASDIKVCPWNYFKECIEMGRVFYPAFACGPFHWRWIKDNEPTRLRSI